MSLWAQIKEALKPAPMDGTGMCMTWGHAFHLVQRENKLLMYCPRCGEWREMQ